MRWLLVVALSLHGFTVSQAEIRTEVVEYKDGDVTLEGFVAWDSAKAGKLPESLWFINGRG